MRVANSAHTSRPWRIHEIVPDFRLEDVWEIDAAGRPDDFASAVEVLASFDPAKSSSFAVRTLFAIRWKLGAVFGWDRPATGVGGRVTTLRDRLPADLRDGPRGPTFEGAPFTSLYLTDDEWAAEVANETVHGVMHIGRIADGHGGYRGQMAVYVKPNGLLGEAYMTAIRPFRHWLVYPPLLREFEQRLQAPLIR
jgi:hypothetical protein